MFGLCEWPLAAGLEIERAIQEDKFPFSSLPRLGGTGRTPAGRHQALDRFRVALDRGLDLAQGMEAVGSRQAVVFPVAAVQAEAVLAALVVFPAAPVEVAVVAIPVAAVAVADKSISYYILNGRMKGAGALAPAHVVFFSLLYLWEK